MVVPFPDHARRSLDAVLAGHRRLLRMTADDARRRSRIAPEFQPAHYAPKSASIPLRARPAPAFARLAVVSAY